MPFSLRLDRQTEAKIRRLAAGSGQSKSAVVREAVARYEIEAPSHSRSTPSAFDSLQPYIGRVRTGGRHFSRDTHAKYRAALRQKHRGRRSR
jgi:hypothetical protein